MKFNPDAINQHFSTEKILTPEDKESIARALLRPATGGMPVIGSGKKRIGEKDGFLSKIFGVLLLGLFAVTGISLFLGLVRIMFFCFGMLFAVGGLMVLTGDPNASVANNSMPAKATGLMIFLIGAVISSGAVLSIKFGTQKTAILFGGILFFLSGMFFFISMAADIFGQRGLFCKRVTGKCIGYVRESNEEGGPFSLNTFAVFEYYLDDELCTAVDSRKCPDPPIIDYGDECELNVSKADKYGITSCLLKPEKKPTFLSLLFPLLFVAVGVFLMIFPFTKYYKPVNGGGKNVVDGSVITDEWIDGMLAQNNKSPEDWYIVDRTVTDKIQIEGGYEVRFSDGESLYYTDEAAEDFKIGGRLLTVRDKANDDVLLNIITSDHKYCGDHEYTDKR